MAKTSRKVLRKRPDSKGINIRLTDGEAVKINGHLARTSAEIGVDVKLANYAKSALLRYAGLRATEAAYKRIAQHVRDTRAAVEGADVLAVLDDIISRLDAADAAMSVIS